MTPPLTHSTHSNDTTADTPVATSDLMEESQAIADQVKSDKPALPLLNESHCLPTDNDTTDIESIVNAVAVADVKSTAQAPQSISTPASPVVSPSTSRAGWTSFSNLPNPGEDTTFDALASRFPPELLAELYSSSRKNDMTNQQPKTLLAKYLSEFHYGEWYHNTSAFMFTVVFTWLLTHIGGGLVACMVVGAFVATYYQTSMQRLRRNVRDDIQRELMINRLETEEESAGWINHFLSRFWLIYEPHLSAQIIGTADAILMDNTPAFLDSIRLSTFTLGTKAPIIEAIKTHPKTEPNVVCMDWTVSFVPNDTLDMTRRDLQAKVNPKIILTIRVGKGMLGAGMPVLLEDLAFKATMRLKFKLFNTYPHIKTVEVSFLDKPMFDYVLKPIGGEMFGFDINNIPGLQTFVKDQVHATLGPMMYAPNVYTLDVAAMMTGVVDIDSASGVVVVTISSASNLKEVDLFGSLDPYITLHLGSLHNPEQARTAYHENNVNPKFDETHFMLVNNLRETIYFQVIDHNIGRKDTPVGVASVDLSALGEANHHTLENLNLTVTLNGKPMGDIRCSLRYFSVSKPTKLSNGVTLPPEPSNSGILRFTVHECKNLGGQGLRTDGSSAPLASLNEDTNAYAIVRVNGKDRLKTKTYKQSINPRWNKSVELFVADKTKVQLGVNIMNSNEFSDDDVLGRWRASLSEMIQKVSEGVEWWNLKDGTGRIHLTATWKPVVMTGFADGLGSGHYRQPIGIVSVKMIRAEDLKNVEALTGGKSDPYVRILTGVQVRGQTEHVDDDLNPVWNQTLYIPVHSVREDLTFEVMDYNDIQKDKLLGLYDFALKDIIQESVLDGQLTYEYIPPVARWVDLMNNDRTKGKGKLHFEVSYYPALRVPESREANSVCASPVTPATPVMPITPTTPTTPTTFKTPIAPAAIKSPTTPVTPTTPTTPAIPVNGEVGVGKTSYQPTTQGIGEKPGTIDLTKHTSGILTVTIHQAKFRERYKAFADILVDSNNAQYRTLLANGRDLPFNETGDAFVKELDFSRVTVRVRTPKDNEKDTSYIGMWSSNVRDILRKMENMSPAEIENGVEYPLSGSDGATIQLSFKYTPVTNFVLDPSESLENQGSLTVTAISASKLKAVDRSGTSDPYVVFYLNSEKVYKTETYKKQLNPVFKNEMFTVPVPKRIGSTLIAMIYDWDQIGKDRLICQAEIPFSGQDIESFVARQMDIPLGEGAYLTVRLLWQPQILVRKRTSTSLFGSTSRIFTSTSSTC